MGICHKTIGNRPLPTRDLQYQNRSLMTESDRDGVLWLPAEWRSYWRVLWEIADEIYDGLHDYQTRSRYLWQKAGESDEVYTVRLLSSTLDNHFRDAIDFYAGLLSQFEARENTPEILTELFDNVDGLGNSLQVVSLMADKEILKKDSCLLFVDPPVEGQDKKRPRLRIVSLSDIYSPIVERVGDRYILTQVCIRCSKQVRDGEYGVKNVTQYWMYTTTEVIVFEEFSVSDNKDFALQIVESRQILKADGAPLMQVPAVWYSCGGGVPMVPETPPLHRLLEVSVKQLNKVSELDDAESKVNTITPYRIWPNEIPIPPPPMRLGPNAVCDIGDGEMGAKVGMLEAQGNATSLSHQRNQDRVEQMKELSRAFIGGRSSLTATEARQNDSRSKVNLQLVAHTKESAFQEVFRLMMQFLDPNFKVEDFEGGIKISDEALRSPVDANDIREIRGGYLDGSYSRRYMLEKLKEVGFQPEGIDLQEELNYIPEVGNAI